VGIGSLPESKVEMAILTTSLALRNSRRVHIYIYVVYVVYWRTGVLYSIFFLASIPPVQIKVVELYWSTGLLYIYYIYASTGTYQVQ
jgi:hypothetical protein